MPPGKHALLGASSAKRWLSCTPSARLEEALREKLGDDGEGSVFAAEGTKAHELAELKLRKELGEINQYNFDERVKELGEIPTDMHEATDTYVEIVMERYFEAKKTCPDARLMLETRLDFSAWVPHGFGTGDAIIIGDTVLDVIDYKHGKGVPVDAVDNPQARLYGLGALELLGSLYDFKVIRSTLVQPRLDNITTESLSRRELLDWAENEVKDRAALAWAGKGEFCPGDHCQFCKVKAVCSARAAESLKIFQTGLTEAGVLPDSQIPALLACATIAKKWIADLEAYAQAMALRGQTVRGYKLVRGRSNRAWSDPEGLKDNLLRAGYKTEDIITTELKSVSEIEKMLGMVIKKGVTHMNIELIIALIVIAIITAIFGKHLRILIEDRDRAMDKCRDAQQDAVRAERTSYEERHRYIDLKDEMQAKLAEAEEQIAVFQKLADETAAELEIARKELAHANQRIEDLKASRTRCYWAKPNCRK